MLKAVKDSLGEVVLYDIFFAGQWLGSRRTFAEAYRQLLRFRRAT